MPAPTLRRFSPAQRSQSSKEARACAHFLDSASATGTGELFIRQVVTHDISAQMDYLNLRVDRAAGRAIDKTAEIGGPGSGGGRARQRPEARLRVQYRRYVSRLGHRGRGDRGEDLRRRVTAEVDRPKTGTEGAKVGVEVTWWVDSGLSGVPTRFRHSWTPRYRPMHPYGSKSEDVGFVATRCRSVPSRWSQKLDQREAGLETRPSDQIPQ